MLINGKKSLAKTRNCLYVFGCMGGKYAFLNLSKNDAINRYAEICNKNFPDRYKSLKTYPKINCEEFTKELLKEGEFETINFNDLFESYDLWENES